MSDQDNNLLNINALSKEIEMPEEAIIEYAKQIIQKHISEDIGEDVHVTYADNKICIYKISKKGNILKKEIGLQNISRLTIMKIKKDMIDFIVESRNSKKEKDIKIYIDQIVKGKIINVFHGKANVMALQSCFKVPRKNFSQLDHIENNKRYTFLLYFDNKTGKVNLTRSSNEFVIKLLEKNIPEIGNKDLEIIDIKRNSGIRSVVIIKNNLDIRNSISKCIGYSGERLKSIISELSGEKIIFYDEGQPIVRQITYFFRIEQSQYNIVVKNTEKETKIFADNMNIVDKIENSHSMKKIWHDITGKLINIKFVDSFNDILEMLNCVLIDIGEQSIKMTLAQYINKIEDLYNIKPSYMNINMLMNMQKIKQFIYTVMEQTCSRLDINDKIITKIISEDITIKELNIMLKK